MNSWYTELSGVHYKLGRWWVPEREENGIILYRAQESAPPGVRQKLTKRQKELFRQGEEDLRFTLDCNELMDGDEPMFITPLFREGEEIGLVCEYFGESVRVVKRYLYADYGSQDAAERACCWDDAFRAFLDRYVCEDSE